MELAQVKSKLVGVGLSVSQMSDGSDQFCSILNSLFEQKLGYQIGHESGQSRVSYLLKAPRHGSHSVGMKSLTPNCTYLGFSSNLVGV